MRHVAAYLLCVLGGNESPKAEDVQKVLSAVSIDSDEEKLSTLIKDLEGKNIAEVIAAGQEKLSTVSIGGGASSAGGAAAAGGAEAAEEAKKEEEEEEEADLGGGMDMFGGG